MPKRLDKSVTTVEEVVTEMQRRQGFCGAFLHEWKLVKDTPIAFDEDTPLFIFECENCMETKVDS